MLPANALAHIDPFNTCKANSASVCEWLERLKPGWASRFFPAFERAGIVELRKAAVLNSSQRDTLEVELRKQGARLVQMKQLNKAIDVLSNTKQDVLSGTPAGSPALISPKGLQSPMSDYLSETESSPLFIILNSKSPKASCTPRSLSDSLYLPGQVLTEEGDNDAVHSSKTSQFDEEEAQATPHNSACHLSYKSPMAAFFDGDDVDDFHMSSAEDLGRGENSGQSWPTDCNAAPNLPFVYPPGVFSAPLKHSSTSMQYKSALRKEPSSKSNRVVWADEVADDAHPLLSDMLDASISNVAGLSNCVWQLAQDPKGTFEVQRAFDECTSDQQRMTLVAQLRGHVFEATQCPHANHVLRKVISVMPPERLDFIILELLNGGPRGPVETARHRYGCRIIEELLSRCKFEQTRCIVECLFAEASSLCTNIYGNFVMQRLFECGVPSDRKRLLRVVCEHLNKMGTSFYGSAVVGKALQHSDDIDRMRLARAIVASHGLLAAIRRYRHGKEVVDLVATILGPCQSKVFLLELAAAPLKCSKSSFSQKGFR
jgi:hypothetical protein